MRHTYDKSKAVVGDNYQVSGNSFDLSELSSSNTERYQEQWGIDAYYSSMPMRPIHYMFNKDTSSDSRIGFENPGLNFKKIQEVTSSKFEQYSDSRVHLILFCLHIS